METEDSPLSFDPIGLHAEKIVDRLRRVGIASRWNKSGDASAPPSACAYPPDARSLHKCQPKGHERGRFMKLASKGPGYRLGSSRGS